MYKIECEIYKEMFEDVIVFLFQNLVQWGLQVFSVA